MSILTKEQALVSSAFRLAACAAKMKTAIIFPPENMFEHSLNQARDLFSEEKIIRGSRGKHFAIASLSREEVDFAEEFFKELGCVVA